MVIVIGIAIGLAVGAGFAFLSLYAFAGSRLAAARRTRQLIISEAKREADALRREAQIEAREESIRVRSEVEQEVTERRAEIIKIEERVLAKEEEIDRKLTELSRREQGVADREVHTKQLQEELKEARDAELGKLERISGMTVKEAKAHLLERSEELIRHELARRVRQAVVLSSFDGIRREVARMTLTKLIEDGRIHPARIEEMYYQSKAELEDHIRQAGEQAVFEANCGEFNEELVKVLGRLRYRTSYGQNVLKHTLEVVQLAGIMASELEASAKTAKRAALLHDVGKAKTHEVEGSHAQISTQLARRYGESVAVCHAIEAHHYEVQPQTVEAVLLIAADAISASRPGARGESLEHYIKRLEALEELAASKPGVEKVYALQAGREIRVIGRPAPLGDEAAVLLSHEIARDIEDQLEYPGQVKVTVIRESRAVDVARNVTNGGAQQERMPAPEPEIQPDQAT